MSGFAYGLKLAFQIRFAVSNQVISICRGLNIKLLIASTRLELFRNIKLPNNVKVQGFSHEEYLKKMANCKINIVALKKGLLHSGGQQTFLNSMYLGKPTIVTDPEGASDYINHGIDGILVEPGDHLSLREEIQILINILL